MRDFLKGFTVFTSVGMEMKMKHLLSILDLEAKDIDAIYDLTDQIKEGKIRQPLAGKTAVLFFPESSIRTRLSFEKGINDLGGKCMLFPPATLDKREALMDVIKYIENWADFVVVRHKDLEKMKELARHANIPVINAMSSENHPCEILSDLYGLSCLKKDYKALTYTFVGEHANISKSWMHASETLKFKLNHVCLPGHAMKDDDDYYHFSTVLDDVIPVTDVVLTDPLSSSMRNEAYYQSYQITLERMHKACKGAVLNPCPPFFRGEEVSRDVIDSEYFIGHDFKKGLIHAQQAIILYCLSY